MSKFKTGDSVTIKPQELILGKFKVGDKVEMVNPGTNNPILTILELKVHDGLMTEIARFDGADYPEANYPTIWMLTNSLRLTDRRDTKH